jgi:T-complex protein 1 subunit delta
VELAVPLAQYADEIGGEIGHCVRTFANSLDIVPYTLAENAGLNPLDVVTRLRELHLKGGKNLCVSIVAKGGIADRSKRTCCSCSSLQRLHSHSQRRR